MPVAVVRVRALPHYRHDAFISGLKRAGYEVLPRAQPKSKRDFLVVWNRYGIHDAEAERWERDGGTVLVAENGYIGKDGQGRQLYALSVGQHHAGLECDGDDRLASLDIELKPWRDGEYVLICGQRGIGSRLMASPPGWHALMNMRLRECGRPVRVRTHPGNSAPKVAIEDDLANAYACVIWSSGSGVKALSLGVPVFYAAPRWICEDAALRPESLGSPLRDDAKREMAFRRMAGSQFTVAEIESGEPFLRVRC